MFSNIFVEEWRACLRAHYFHVIKEEDTNNERSLETVLIQTGFSEDELVTMRAEIFAELGWEPENIEAPEQVLAYEEHSELPAEIAVPEDYGSLDELIESQAVETADEAVSIEIAESAVEDYVHDAMPDFTGEVQIAEDLVENAIREAAAEPAEENPLVESVAELEPPPPELIRSSLLMETPTETPTSDQPEAPTSDSAQVWTLPPKKKDKKEKSAKAPKPDKPDQMSLF